MSKDILASFLKTVAFLWISASILEDMGILWMSAGIFTSISENMGIYICLQAF